MFEAFGFEEITARQMSLWFGLGLGLAFGVLAEVTRFCLRRAVVGADARAAAGVWAAALAVAVVGTQAAVAAGSISFADHRFHAPDLPWLAIIAGGLMFGAGMVLTRGCVSRLAVLSGSGNLRALTVLLIFAVTAHATLKGVLSPVRTALGNVTLSLGDYASLAALPGGGWLWSGLIALAALALALRSGNRPALLLGGATIGALAVLGWLGTGFVLLDEFDPIAQESLSFTLPASETLFWTIASTAVEPGFGPGLLGGVIAGAALAALISGRFTWASFEAPAQTGRYALGALLMGVGGVLAGGCTLGAGLSGVPTLGVSALLALAAIILGARLTAALPAVSAPVAAPTTRPLQPAE